MGKIEGTEDEEEYVSIYRKSLTKRKDTYWKLEEEILDRILWRASVRTNYGPVVTQTTGDDSKSRKKETPGALS